MITKNIKASIIKFHLSFFQLLHLFVNNFHCLIYRYPNYMYTISFLIFRRLYFSFFADKFGKITIINAVFFIPSPVIFYYADFIYKLYVASYFFKTFSNDAIFDRFILINSASRKYVKRVHSVADKSDIIFTVKNNCFASWTIFKNNISFFFLFRKNIFLREY